MRKILAFTLAETLIVMGIIGIVSALTLPNLNSSTGEKEKIARVTKIYSNLNDAYGRAVAVYGPVDEWFTNDANASAQLTRFGDRMTEFMKVTKNCGTSTDQNCFSGGQNVVQFNGTKLNFQPDKLASCYKFILADGSSVYIQTQSKDVLDQDNFRVWVNIGGSSKAPIRGKNTFDYFVYLDKSLGVIFDERLVSKVSGGELGVLKDCLTYGYYCTAWIIKTGNMDYLKTDANAKCPNGKVLDSTTNPSCK